MGNTKYILEGSQNGKKNHKNNLPKSFKPNKTQEEMNIEIHRNFTSLTIKNGLLFSMEELSEFLLFLVQIKQTLVIDVDSV